MFIYNAKLLGSITTTVVETQSFTETATTLLKNSLCDASSGNIIVTLPTAVKNIAQLTYTKIDSSSNVVIIEATNGQKIDQASTLEITSQFSGFTITSDGSNWWVVAGNSTSSVESSPIISLPNTINSNYTVPVGYNAFSIGPITTAPGVTVTVPSGSVWKVL